MFDSCWSDCFLCLRVSSSPICARDKYCGYSSLVKNTHLDFLVIPQVLERFVGLRAGLLDGLGLFDQHVTLTCFDVDFGLFLVDLRLPRLKLLLFLLDLVMKYLRLV